MSQVHVNILRNARDLIDNECQRFICIAINEVARHEISYHMENVIAEMLGNHNTYDSWLAKKYPKLYYRSISKHGYARLKEARLQWIDWMIANHQIFD